MINSFLKGGDVNKVALVTGASAGIGWEIANQLAERGYDLLLVARREDRLRELASILTTHHGRNSEVLALDVADPSKRQELVARMRAVADRLTLVVNNAGFGIVGPTIDAHWHRIRSMLELNLTALTELSYQAAKIMVPKRQGGLINVASTAAFQAVPYMNAYSATKAYVLSFTEALAEELAEYGIRVMALCPGYTRTEFQQVAGAREDDVRGRSPMSAAECVRIGLRDFERGKRVSVTGTGNKLLVFGSWLAPRRLVIKSASRMMKDRAKTPYDSHS